ncbi:synaptotagmin 47 [Elysia marginata]|uniref:Synaptotagmin 47 n=1 Tax=Elysia marginata TaxID=1093978 RepID=A0AAV4INJ9_9GAST|nr:synaptotagmin 47 [Elysia marginata]
MGATFLENVHICIDITCFFPCIYLGEVTSDLSKLELRPGEEFLFNELIEGYNEEDLGEIHVALMYLPTAEKLSVTLLNARSLRALEGTKKNMETYVKILMMYDGRPIKKTKTACRVANDSSPVYNETFVFDVPPYQLDKVYFNLAVIGVNKVGR